MMTSFKKNLPIVMVSDKDKRLTKEHYPWIFGKSVRKVDSNVKDGDMVSVHDKEKRFIAYGFYNSRSQIPLRLFEWDAEKSDLQKNIKEKIENAYYFRNHILNITKETDAYRLINGEGDFLPGLIVDIYSKSAVVQINLFAFYKNLELIISEVQKKTDVERILVKADESYAEKEGFELKEYWAWGGGDGKEIIHYGHLSFVVELLGAQKTGFYLDQRENRRIVRELAGGKKVLDCFCFSGSFAIFALNGGAKEAVCVDSSQKALTLAKENLNLNKYTAHLIRAKAFDFLKEYGSGSEKFEMIILDPPKFAPTKKDYVSALKGYFELNRMAMKILVKNGILVSCSCSQQVDEESFIKIINQAAISIRRRMKIITVRTQASDHTFVPSCPETRYLKCVVCIVE